MPVTVEVKPRYVRRARQLAKERNQSFEEAEAYDNDDDTWGTEPERRNFLGLMGEFAFAEYADLKVDTSTREWSDGGHDFEVMMEGDRRTVDIKTAQKEPSALMVKEYAVNADYYILGHVDEPTVTLYGGATKETLLNGVRKESRRFDHTNYTLGVHSLEPLPDPSDIEQIR
jgi:hypothetical protein